MLYFNFIIYAVNYVIDTIVVVKFLCSLIHADCIVLSYFNKRNFNQSCSYEEFASK